MKKIFFVFAFLGFSILGFAQRTLITDFIRGLEKIYWESGHEVNGVSNDTTLTAKDSLKLVTEWAMKEFVSKYGGGGVPQTLSKNGTEISISNGNVIDFGNVNEVDSIYWATIAPFIYQSPSLEFWNNTQQVVGVDADGFKEPIAQLDNSATQLKGLGSSGQTVLIDRDSIYCKAWKRSDGNGFAYSNQDVWREGNIGLGDVFENEASINVTMGINDTVGLKFYFPSIAKEEKLIDFKTPSDFSEISLRYRSDEKTLVFAPNLPSFTYGNPKVNAALIIGTGKIGENLVNPFASNVFGFNAVPVCTDCNSMTVSGYQALNYLQTGFNVTANGTDVGYNFRSLTNSNLYGRHIAFTGDGSIEATGSDLNVFGVDSYPVATNLSNVSAFGNFIGSTAIDVQNSLFFGDQSARFRPYVFQSDVIGTLSANLPTNPVTGSGIFASSIRGFRSFNNQDSVYYSTSAGYHSFYLGSYDDSYMTRYSSGYGSEAGLNVWGDRNTFIGYRAGARSSISNINGAVAIGYRAGDLWISDNELVIDNTETTDPLVYGHFGENEIKINGTLEVSTTTGGILLPRLSTSQRNAISNPQQGLLIFNTSTSKLNFYNGTIWEVVTSL